MWLQQIAAGVLGAILVGSLLPTAVKSCQPTTTRLSSRHGAVCREVRYLPKATHNREVESHRFVREHSPRGGFLPPIETIGSRNDMRNVVPSNETHPELGQCPPRQFILTPITLLHTIPSTLTAE